MSEPDEWSALLWDAVLGDESWEEIPRALATTTGAPTACLLRWQDELHAKSWQHNLDFGLKGDFPSDLLNPETSAVALAMTYVPPGAYLDRRRLMSDQIYEADPSVRELRAQNVYHGLICKLSGRAFTEAGMWIGFHKHQGDACEASAGRFGAWVPLVQRALRARQRLEEAQASEEGCMDMLGHRGVGTVVIDRDLRVRRLNAAAERILAAGDGIGQRRGVLTLASHAAERELRRRVRTLGRSVTSTEALSLPVQRPSGLPAYALDLVPARGLGVEATVLISDPLARLLPDADRLMARFGLTAAEARLARLAPLALSKAQMAEQVGLSENTVRTHLAAARTKLGVRNMVELAVVIARA